MPPAITFALISLTAAGCLEVVFKRFAMKARSRGMYIMGCGIVWLLLQLIYFNAQDLIIQLNSTTVFYGLLTGISVLLANILLIESLAILNVSLGSMIYRLNTIGVVVLSYFFLSESLESTKLSGVLLGISAIVLLYIRENHGDETSTSHHHFLIIAIGSLWVWL